MLSCDFVTEKCRRNIAASEAGKDAGEAAELKGSIAMLEECGYTAGMTEATKAKLEGLEKYGFAERYVDRKPGGWKEIVDVIRAN